MTVAELIAKLQDMPQNAIALTYDTSYLYTEADPVISFVWRDDNHGYISYEGNDGGGFSQRTRTQAVVL